MLNSVSRRRQRWLLFAGRRLLSPRSRSIGFAIAALWLVAVVGLVVVAVGFLWRGTGGAANWPLGVASLPWSLAIVVTSPAWGGFSFSNTPDWVVTVLFGVPALLNASIVGGLTARWWDGRRRRRQRALPSRGRAEV